MMEMKIMMISVIPKVMNMNVEKEQADLLIMVKKNVMMEKTGFLQTNVLIVVCLLIVEIA